ncbi:GTP-binding proten HflX [Xylanimonas cellulosilytica DSM 15894]|uniref:GTPase HflX n=1 Tax=Xylanimonas cellulosilytica (strain DSM 15894 / JCM 12276 / CECT 5975 / KCTC 9989 / LMG 20990 / NBRC 107835 / XIL07) TaxID=446471 RepID=D1C097_XYLCX|nr:GTP-binding proten HflX [Xylanimonas cellulosilytica DSM 15894]
MTHAPQDPTAPDTEHTDDTDGTVDAGRAAQAIANDVVARVLARAGTARAEGTTVHVAHDGEQLDLEERTALRRVAGLSTELDDVTEVEYRQLRLEKVVLIGQYSGGEAAAAEAGVSLRELAALAETAGSEVLDGLLQRRQKPDPGTYLGSGKAAELAELVRDVGADTVVADTELAPSQRRALEDIVKVKVIDRTALILDIFAQHAKSREGKAQVELAQLEYLLPRLRGWGDSMSRQAGGQVGGQGAGMGSRGPGETKIELDRRRIRNRMAKLRREIKEMAPARATKRVERKRHAIPNVAIAGYTNAGKSSLLNALTDAGVLVENALFATLDPTVRRATTDDGRVYTLADTVGFVRHLPHQLVEAFRSTLEEVGDAALLLHVVDASHPDPEGQIAAVREVLAEIPGIDAVREVVVLNKADVADPEVIGRIQRREKRTVVVSAHTGEGIAELRHLIADELPRPEVAIDLVVPYSRGDLVNRVHQFGELDHEEHLATGTLLRGRVDEALAAELQRAAV